MPSTEFLTALAGVAGGSGIGALFTSRAKASKLYSDSAVELSRAYGMLLDRHNADLDRLDKEMSSMRTERAALMLELAAARDENNKLRAPASTSGRLMLLPTQRATVLGSSMTKTRRGTSATGISGRSVLSRSARRLRPLGPMRSC